MSSPQHTRDIPPLDDRIQKNRARGPTPSPTTASTRQATAQRIFEKIQRCWNGQPVNIPVAASIRLRRSQYHQLLSLLAQDEQIQDFAFKRLKLFYDRRRRKLSYEMPSAIHEVMTAKLVQGIHFQLSAIEAKHDNVLQLSELLEWTNSSNIELPGDSFGEKKSPDAVWEFTTPEKAGECFFFEVCFSQSLRAAVEKTRQIIYRTYGRPGMGLVVKVDYNTPKQLLNLPEGRSRAACYTAFGWVPDEKEDGRRGNIVRRTMKQQEFRNKDGDVVPGKLSIKLREFIGPEYYKYIPNVNDPAVEKVLDEAITIDNSTMAKWLAKAEADAIRRDPALAPNTNYIVTNDEDGDEGSTNIDNGNDKQGYRIVEYDSDIDGGEKSSSSSGSSHPSQEASGSEFEPSSPRDPSDVSTDSKTSSRDSLLEEALNNAASRSRSSTLSDSPDPLSTDSEEHVIKGTAASAPKRTHSRTTSTSTTSTDPLSTNAPDHRIPPDPKSRRLEK